MMTPVVRPMHGLGTAHPIGRPIVGSGGSR